MNIIDQRVKKTQLSISYGCTKENFEILKAYWKFKDEAFVYTAEDIKNMFNISQSQLTLLNRRHVKFTFYIYCDNCMSNERHIVDNQTQFHKLTKRIQSGVSYCDFCQDYCPGSLNQELNNWYVKDENAKLIKAIKNKNWELLTKFESEVLKKCLETKFKQLDNYYYKKLGRFNFSLFIKALEKLENLGLLELQRNKYAGNEIDDYNFLAELRAFKDEISKNFIKEIV